VLFQHLSAVEAHRALVAALCIGVPAAAAALTAARVGAIIESIRRRMAHRVCFAPALRPPSQAPPSLPAPPRDEAVASNTVANASDSSEGGVACQRSNCFSCQTTDIPRAPASALTARFVAENGALVSQMIRTLSSLVFHSGRLHTAACAEASAAIDETAAASAAAANEPARPRRQCDDDVDRSSSALAQPSSSSVAGAAKTSAETRAQSPVCLARVVLDAGLHAMLVEVLLRYVPRLGASVGGASRQAIMRVAVLWAWRAFEYIRVEFDQVDQVIRRVRRALTNFNVAFNFLCVGDHRCAHLL
jgi:hypothetical protein